MHAGRLLLALFLVPAVAGPIGAGEGPDRAADAAPEFLPAEACKTCHPQHYEEWRGSMHAYALTDPVFHAMHRLGQEETRGELGDFCVRCHAPVGVATGEVGAGTRSIEGLSPRAAAAVSCEVCHRDVRLAEGHPRNASFEFRPGAPLVGGIPDPAPNPFHASKTDASLRRPEFCGSCHNVVNSRGVPVEKPHDEYAASPYPLRGVGCIDCHMQTYTGRATPDGPLRNHLHRHDFVGVDVALTPFPREGLQRREVEAFLRTAARMTLSVPPRTVAGDELRFEVHVKNSGAGHNLPTGPSTERQMWIEVLVRRGDGSVVFHSGGLDAQGDLMDEHSEIAPGADPQLALFTDRFLGEDGEEVYFMWRAHRLEEGTIPPLETRTARYSIPVPADAAGETLELSVRLKFRAFPPHQLRRLGIGELAERFPVFEMAASERHVEVAESLKVPGRIRVPEDAADLRTAIARARDGDELLVAPGRYRLDAPLDFAGRALQLRSRSGPEATVIEFAPEGAGLEAGSLIVFASGEGPRAVVEGFTLRGGRGTSLGEIRAGGAVLCLESSPTLHDNIFTENEAGFGGAVFLRGSSAVLAGNRFERNRAEVAGGAAAAVEGSRVFFDGNRFVGNQAPEGGALWMEEGSSLAGNHLRANVAFRGGAVAIHAPAPGAHGAATLLLGDQLAGNSARVGGALLLQATRGTRLERVLLAGNIGAALRVEAGGAVEVLHATVVDNRLGPGPLDIEAGSHARVRSSIFWDNRPAALAGDIAWSLVEDEGWAAGTNRHAFPLFRPPRSVWEHCAGAEEGCVPIFRAGATELEPTSSHLYRRYRAGRLELFVDSPAVDAGDPAAPPDPDGTRADAGAVPHIQSGRLFIRGDLDGDGAVAVPDLGALLAALSGGGDLPCREAADIDDDGTLGVADAALLFAHLLGSVPRLPAPFPDCSADPRLLSSLGCFEDRCPR